MVHHRNDVIIRSPDVYVVVHEALLGHEAIDVHVATTRDSAAIDLVVCEIRHVVGFRPGKDDIEFGRFGRKDGCRWRCIIHDMGKDLIRGVPRCVLSRDLDIVGPIGKQHGIPLHFTDCILSEKVPARAVRR